MENYTDLRTAIEQAKEYADKVIGYANYSSLSSRYAEECKQADIESLEDALNNLERMIEEIGNAKTR